ncbi:MAG: hypothetical protein AAFQ42_05630 [Pseudomonadota bacterium]
MFTRAGLSRDARAAFTGAARMYYVYALLGGLAGLDALTYAVVFVWAFIGTRILRTAILNVLLAWSFLPILFIAGVGANLVAQIFGYSFPFDVPFDELTLVRHVPMEDFLVTLLISFLGVLIGLGAIFAMYRAWGHTGEVRVN